MIACLAKISPLNTITGERFDVYLSSVGDAINGPKVNGLGGFTWEPATITLPSLAMQLWNGDFQNSVQAGQAALPVNIATAKKTYPAIDSAAWMGAAIEIYAEEPGTAWPWTKRFAGRISNWEGAYPRLNFTAEVDPQPFAANMLTETYPGTGGLGGGDDLKNRPRPLILGYAANVEPVLIDAVNSVYQFSGYGPIEGVTKLYERGSDFGESMGDAADYAALVAADIPAGRWASCNSAGLVRLGAPAYGVITGDVAGHVVGSATPRLTGSVISALALIAGVSTGTGSIEIITAPLDSVVSVVPVITPGPGAILTAALGSVVTAALGDVVTASLGSVVTAAPGDVITPDQWTIDTGVDTAPLASVLTAPPAAFDTSPSDTIETGSLAALDIAVPYPINIVITEQTTFLELAQRLVLPCNWISGISLIGKFFVASITLAGTEVMTLDAQGRSVPQVLAAPEESVSPPYTKTTMGAARSWRVHSADEIAFQATLIDRGLYDDTVTYREGNIVETADGSTWVYVNATAGAGNDPPTWPETSNEWWENRTPPGGTGYIASLTAETQNIAAASNGSVASYASLGGTYQLRLDGTPLTGVAYSVVSEVGIDVSINAVTGVYTVSSMSANTGVATFRATYLGLSWDKVYTVTKQLQGLPGPSGSGSQGDPGVPATSIVTTKKQFSVYGYADGTVPSGNYADANGQLTVWSGNTNVTAAASLSATPLNCNGTINTAANTPVSGKPKGYYQISSMPNGADAGTLTLTATYGGQTIVEIISVSKLKTGYQIIEAADPLPTSNLFDGRQVYWKKDQKLYTYTGTPGAGGEWSSKVVPSQLTATLGSINPDPNFEDLNFWTLDGVPLTTDSDLPAFIQDFAGFGNQALMGVNRLLVWRNDSNFSHLYTVNSTKMPMQGAGRSVTIRFRFRNSCNCSFLIGLEFFDVDGNSTGGVFKTVGANTSVAEYSAQGAIPSQTAFARFTMRNNSDGTGGSDWALLSGLQAFFSIDTDLLTAGAVKTDKLDAGAVTAAKVAATDVITMTGQIRDLTVVNAHIQNLTLGTGKIQDQAVSNTQTVELASAIPQSNFVESTVLSTTFDKKESGSIIRADAMLLISSTSDPRDVIGYVRVFDSSGTFSKSWYVEIHGAGSSQLWVPVTFFFVFTGVPAGARNWNVSFTKTGGGSNVWVNPQSLLGLREEKK